LATDTSPTVLSRPVERDPDAPAVRAAALTPLAPCTVCASPARWDDAGVWRCTACWPQPLTAATRTAEAQPLAPLTRRTAPPPPAPVVGPRRPPFVCPTCTKPSTWPIRGQAWVCYRCEHRISQPQEDAA
jgi:ribosomal protein L37AE/L43A